MARNFAGSCAVLIVLVLAPNLARAQAQQPGAYPSEKLTAQSQQTSRIVSLLGQLADQARVSDDVVFSVRAQSQAATLLWPHAPERARTIYRGAFESLAGSPKPDQRPNTNASLVAGTELTASRKRQLRSELLNQIAARDADLAEELAKSIADKADNASRDCINGSADCGSAASDLAFTLVARGAPSKDYAERRELLMSAAMQVVEREPQQAMAFAQMSVALGISSNLARLLTLMRTVDAERADLLFSNAVARLEESPTIELTELHTLGSFVVSVVNSSPRLPLARQLVIRFLNLALNRMSTFGMSSPEMTNRDESAAYFVGRQLTELVTRYLPERAGQLRRDLGDAAVAANEVGTYESLSEPIELGPRAPGDIARAASEATDKAECDSLWARAALEWLARGDIREAREAALGITNEATRDRVLAQIIRRCSSEKRIEDALELSRRVSDISLRSDMVVILANAALASRDETRAAELLNEAASYSAKAPMVDRARSLIRIAGGFAAFDDLRAFDILQSGIKAINDTNKRQQDQKDEPASSTKSNGPRYVALDDLNSASLGRTLAALATSDFDRALGLAQQLSVQDASIEAQLAVCRAGLMQKPPVARATISDDTESSQNH
jgi:hypothetical protein